ncbi:MAG: glutathione S-transferase family protein [Inquilinaceae bacterium]
MTIHVTAFRWVPPFVQGYVKDLRVRWALEEAGLPYEATLIDPQVQASRSYRKWQPFGQVPAYLDDEVELFESGAIVLHIAGKSEALAPSDTAGRARTVSWVMAALNSVEPHAQNLIQFDDDGAGDDGAGDAESGDRRARLEAKLDRRLAALCAWLDDKEYLEGRFSAGDLMMTTVLRELVDSGFLSRFPLLDAYRRRCEARPAFGRAMEAHLRPFREKVPA